MPNRVVLVLSAALLAIGAWAALAAVPHLINVQGVLTDDLGNPVPTGVHSVKFRIYDDPVAGSELWSSDGFVPVQVVDGMFSHLAGSSQPLPDSLLDVDSLWLGMTVDFGEEMLPRMHIVSAMYALAAGTATNAIHADTAGYAQAVADNTVTGVKILDGSIQFDDIGQNSATEGQVMKWNGTAWIADSDSVGAGGELTLPYSGMTSEGTNAFAVAQMGSGRSADFTIRNPGSSNDALRAKTDGSGAGLHGAGLRTQGYMGHHDYAVYGYNDSMEVTGFLAGDSIAVYGMHESSGNKGYFADFQYGAYGKHESSGNFGYLGNYEHGVYGKHGSSNAYGYLGGNGAGVYGAHPNNNSGYLGGAQYGVNGYAQMTDNSGVRGEHSLGNYGYLGGAKYGVYGYGHGSGRVGVFGESFFGQYGYIGGEQYAVFGYTESDNPDAAAVRAQNNGDGPGLDATTMSTDGGAAVRAMVTSGADNSARAVDARNLEGGDAIFAQAAHPGYALNAWGDVRVLDTLIIDDAIRGNPNTLTVKNNLYVTGGMTVDGVVQGSFPRPDWNSGWFRLGTDADTTITHGLGGDHRDYFVDLQLMEDSDNTLNNSASGGDIYYMLVGDRSDIGARYSSLGPSTIKVTKGNHANSCDSLRVRIWIVK